MITSLSEIKSNPKLGRLLLAYAELKKAQPDAEWHDRIMELTDVTSDELNRLHGLLLASGWIETRVHGDSFRQAGRLEACYRLTSDGAAALRLSGAVREIPDDESSQVLF